MKMVISTNLNCRTIIEVGYGGGITVIINVNVIIVVVFFFLVDEQLMISLHMTPIR